MGMTRGLCAGLLMMLMFVPHAARAEFLREGEPPDVVENEQKGRAEVPRFDVLAQALSPAVVNISVENGGAAAPEEGEGGEPALPFLKPNPDAEPMRSLGSGIILSENGYIVTNYHVIEKSDKIIVRLLDDKTEYPAKVVGADEKTDLALIKIKPKGKLKVAYMGDSDLLQVGEWVLAIGNQFQLGQTATAGIVSAKSRRVPAKISGPYDAFIQTDASINPGSSGGPLFNTKGQVVGINTAIFSPGRGQFGGTGFNIGIGFAIPINTVKGVIVQLREKGKVTRGLLGVIIQNVSADIAEAMHVPAHGALVSEVMSGTPAETAGFMVKDVILQFNGHPIAEHDDLPLLVANTPVGSTVEVQVLRAGKTLVLNPTIIEMSDDYFKKTEKRKRPEANRIGLAVQNITSEMAKSLELKSANGVIVTSVSPRSPAERAGIARGDIIEEIDSKPIPNAEELAKIVDALPKDKPVLVLVRKREGTRFLTLRVGQ